MKNLTKGNIYKNFFLFSIPLIISGFFSNSFSIINQILSGRYLGEHGLAVSGSISGFVTFYNCTLSGFATGFTVLLTRLYGERNYKRIKDIIYFNIILLLVITTLIGLFLFIFKDVIMNILNVNAGIRETTKVYYSILAVPFFFNAFRIWGNFMMIALGYTVFSFWVSLFTSALEMVLKIIFLEFFDMGIISIAVITQLVSVLLFIIYTLKLKKCFKELKIDKEKVTFNKDIASQSLSLGIPSTFQQMIMYVVSFLISPLVNGIGTAATAAYSIILNIQSISNSVYQNTSKTLTNYTAQCIGMRKFEKIKKGVLISFLQSTIMITPIIVLCSIFALPLCKLYFPKGFSGESLDYCVIFIRYYQLLIFFNLINNMFHSFYRGVMAMKLLVVSTIISSATRILITVLIIKNTGMNGIYLGWVASWIVEAVFNVVIYFTGVWKKEKISKIIAEENLPAY